MSLIEQSINLIENIIHRIENLQDLPNWLTAIVTLVVIPFMGFIARIAKKKISFDRNRYPKEVNPKLRVIDYDEFKSWGWSMKKMMRNIIDMDYRVFGFKEEENVKIWSEQFINHPET